MTQLKKTISGIALWSIARPGYSGVPLRARPRRPSRHAGTPINKFCAVEKSKPRSIPS